MSKMYIRVRNDGFIYEYNEYLAKNPACEVITEEVAYPERFMKPEQAAPYIAPEEPKAKAKTSKTKKKGLDLSTADIPEAPVYTAPELAEEASRGLP